MRQLGGGPDASNSTPAAEASSSELFMDGFRILYPDTLILDRSARGYADFRWQADGAISQTSSGQSKRASIFSIMIHEDRLDSDALEWARMQIEGGSELANVLEEGKEGAPITIHLKLDMEKVHETRIAGRQFVSNSPTRTAQGHTTISSMKNELSRFRSENL